MRNLFIINDAPYGDERPYNALRLAHALAHEPEQEIRVFLMGDAVFIAKRGEKPPLGLLQPPGHAGQDRPPGAPAGGCAQRVHGGRGMADKVLVF